MSAPRKTDTPRPSVSPERPQSRASSSAESFSSRASSVNSKDPNVTVRKLGSKREFAVKNGKNYTRTKKDDGSKTGWEPVENPPEAKPKTQLLLARQDQGDGGPLHWSLVVCKEGNLYGKVFQVKGDALYMRYEHSDNAKVLGSASIRGIPVTLNRDLSAEQENELEKIAKEEPPPHANSMKEVTENCQGWTLRVLAKCVQKGLVPESKLNDCKKYQEPIEK